MYPTPMLWMEIGVAVVLGVAILWTNVEYGLFLYAFALGFPDFACPFGTTINIRLDDVLLLLFLVRTMLWSPAPPSRSQKSIFAWQAIFLAVCVLSIAVETARAASPGAYEAAKMAGCVAILFVLPRLLQSRRRLKFFVTGLMCAGVALGIQVRGHLAEASSNSFVNFQELKSAATFGTWNPNTIGQAAVLLVFAAGLGGIIYSRTLVNRILWPCLAAGVAFMPALLFVRGTTLSIAAGFILFLSLLRRWKWLLLFTAVCACAVFYLHSHDRQLMEDATAVNLTTGEGFSHRFERLDTALQGIRQGPWIGQGFGQEMAFLDLIGSPGRAHNAYLAVWLELGLGGLLLFLAAIFQFVRAGFLLYENPRFQSRGALILALMFALGLDSLGLPTLYWEKLPTIALSLAVAVAGICERTELAFELKDLRAVACEPLAQHS
jgi:O-antigen ligase